jgi:hypothetical protein
MGLKKDRKVKLRWCLKARDARQTKTKQKSTRKENGKRAHVETPAAAEKVPNLFRAVSSPVPL